MQINKAISRILHFFGTPKALRNIWKLPSGKKEKRMKFKSNLVRNEKSIKEMLKPWSYSG